MKRDLLTPFILLLCMAAGLVTSCSEDAPSGDDPTAPKTEFTVNVNTRALNVTRGDFDAEKNELIHSCQLAVVKSDGEVVKVVPFDDSTDGTTGHSYSLRLNEGTYNLYALANVEATYFAGLGFKEGEKVTLSTINEKLYTLAALDAAKNVPMSGFIKGLKVANGKITLGTQELTTVNVDLVRLAGKVEFCFTNNSPEKMFVENITFKPAATGDILLFGYPDGSAPDMTLNGVEVKSELNFSPSLEVGSITDETREKSFSFYLREVASSHPTESFPITINYRRGSKDADLQEMTALLYNLNFINRNDWVKVPVTLTDRKLTLDVDFYPPIGGYPPVDWVDVDDEYYVTFGNIGGWFSITPSVVNKADGTVVAGKYVELSIPATGGITNESFFRVKPSVDSTGAITGEIATGLAADSRSVLTLEVTVTDKDASGNLVTKEKFLRKIHFICK